MRPPGPFIRPAVGRVTVDNNAPFSEQATKEPATAVGVPRGATSIGSISTSSTFSTTSQAASGATRSGTTSTSGSFSTTTSATTSCSATNFSTQDGAAIARLAAFGPQVPCGSTGSAGNRRRFAKLKWLSTPQDVLRAELSCQSQLSQRSRLVMAACGKQAGGQPSAQQHKADVSEHPYGDLRPGSSYISSAPGALGTGMPAAEAGSFADDVGPASDVGPHSMRAAIAQLWASEPRTGAEAASSSRPLSGAAKQLGLSPLPPAAQSAAHSVSQQELWPSSSSPSSFSSPAPGAAAATRSPVPSLLAHTTPGMTVCLTNTRLAAGGAQHYLVKEGSYEGPLPAAAAVAGSGGSSANSPHRGQQDASSSSRLMWNVLSALNPAAPTQQLQHNPGRTLGAKPLASLTHLSLQQMTQQRQHSVSCPGCDEDLIGSGEEVLEAPGA